MSIQAALQHPPHATESVAALNVEKIRKEFPILSESIHGLPLVYLDNAATTQKPDAVLDAIMNYYRHANANVHRGVHLLSQRATDGFESAREAVRAYINAREAREIVFVRGATEAINLVVQAYGRHKVGPGDEVLITAMEHHSNIVPWQMLCEERGATLRVAPIDDTGTLLMDEFNKLLGAHTRIVAVTHVSNALGSINPIKQIVSLAHHRGIPVLVDGAQAAPHMPIDVQDFDCDFYAFSGHKMYGPTGIGVLYGKAALLEEMPPYQGGGDMIRSVTFEKTIYNDVPHKFEAGTPDISGVIGLAAAIAYIDEIGIEAIAAHEDELLRYATERIRTLTGVELIGTAQEKTGVLSFVISGIHPHDIGTVLDQQGIAVRTGHHCAQPVMERFHIPATVRASFGMYNTLDEIDALVRGLEKVKEIFG
jgi:cysteine desulfurase/selenocysteine lyase